MKVNGTRRFYARAVSLLLVAAVTLLCFGTCPVWAAGEPKSITPVLYTADSTDIISSWEGSAGESSETEWTNWGIITESYDKNLQAEHISMPTSTDDRNIIVNFNPGLTKGENAYANLVIGARASADTDFHVNYMKSGGNFLEDGIDFTVSGGDTFKEYTVINPSGWNNWVWLPQMDTLRLLVSGGKCTEARTVDIAYIRVVKQTYGSAEQTAIQSGAVDYNVEDSIVDFDFGEALKESSVNPSKITINGMPVRWAMTLPEKPNRIRINLGDLKRGTPYKVSFSDLQTAEGTPITNSDFTFTTTIPSSVDGSVTMHKAAPQTTGVVSSWEGALVQSSLHSDEGNGSDTNALPDGQKAVWENWGFINESYDKKLQVEHITILDNSGQGSRTILLNFTPHLDTKYTGNTSSVKKLAIGARASCDFSFHTYYWGKDNNGADEGMSVDFTIGKSDDLREYIVPLGNGTQWFWSLSNLRMDVRESGSGANTMDIAYIRLVDDTYTGPLSGDEGENITPGPFTDTYDAEENNVFDLVFDQDLNLSTVTAENITFNGKPADWVMTDPTNKRRVRVALGALTPLTRGRLEISRVETSTGEWLKDMEFCFTSAGADVQTGELPVISTFDLVTDYRSPNEAPVTPDTDMNGKTVTAVVGGLYNNTEEPKSYMLMLACYDENDTLVDAAAQTYHLCSYESLSETGTSSGTGTGATKVDLKVPSNGKYTVRAFAWDADTLSPLRRVVSSIDGQ